MKRVRILLADDHDIVLQGLLHILDVPEIEVVGTARDGLALVEAARDLKPDLIVADLSMPLLGGIRALRMIRQHHESPKVIFLTMHPEVPYVMEALSAGASGYVLKSSVVEELLPAVRQVLRGQTYVADALRTRVAEALEARSARPRSAVELVTPRQREVLRCLSRGLQTKEIADELHVSPKTIEFHKHQMKQALGVQTIAELVAYAVSRGIVE